MLSLRSYGPDCGEQPGALPIILTHGWPSSFLELATLARRLATPTRHGGRPEDAFTVIVPSLPGFGFTPQAYALPPALPTHELWHRLMHDELGFSRYAAHSGDLGAGISARLGQAHPEAVVGIHVLAVGDPEHPVFRPYYEHHLDIRGALRRVTVPTAVAVFPKDLTQPPRSWAERSYNVTRYTTMPRGGHFAAHEEPELLGDDITAFFRPLR